MLPLSRNTTYTPASPVKAQDLLDIQDSIIGGKHGLLTLSVGFFQFVNLGTATAPITLGHSLIDSPSADVTAAAQSVAIGLALNGLPNGTRIVNVRVYLKDVNAQPLLTVSLRGGNRAGASGVGAVTANSAANGTTQTITLAAVNWDVGVTSVGPVYLKLATASNATGTYSIYGVELDIQKT